jgi:chromosome segregation ATPase
LISRLGRKRRERRAPTQPDHPFAIEACEYLTDGAFALLRVSGTGSVAPVSLVTQGDGPQAFDPLPQPDGGAANGSWQIAFALPTEVIEPGSRVWLHDGGLYLADLMIPLPAEVPQPAEPVVTPEAQDAAERLAAVEERIAAEKEATAARPAEDVNLADDARARRLVEAWSEAATLREKLNDHEEELAEALKELLEARKDVEPLRDRAEELTDELAAAREELELAHNQGRDTRLRATEKAAELDAVRAELAAAEPRVAEAERAREAAEQEVAKLRAQVEQLEQALSAAREEAQAGRSSAEELRSKLSKLEGKTRRSGSGRRADDQSAQKARAELEARLAEREQRIEQLEKEAESFAARREEAVDDSVRERIDQLEADVRQQAGCNDDLRALLESERQLVAAGRREVEDLKRQLAVVGPERVDEPEQPARPVPRKPVVTAPKANGAEAPPWSALDAELLARIEKAKALTR